MVYSYITNHLGVEKIQTKGDNRAVSTAKMVWKENNTKDEHKASAQNESVYEQLLKQHTLIDGVKAKQLSKAHQSITVVIVAQKTRMTHYFVKHVENNSRKHLLRAHGRWDRCGNRTRK
jgi:hypothetical protein